MIRIEAPAKINLCLRVGGRRSDGFHRVVTVFVALGLADVLEIEPADATEVDGFEADTLVRGTLDLLGETRVTLAIIQNRDTKDIMAQNTPAPDDAAADPTPTGKGKKGAKAKPAKHGKKHH